MASTSATLLSEIKFAHDFEAKVWSKTYLTTLKHFLKVKGGHHSTESAALQAARSADTALEEFRKRVPTDDGEV